MSADGTVKLKVDLDTSDIQKGFDSIKLQKLQLQLEKVTASLEKARKKQMDMEASPLKMTNKFASLTKELTGLQNKYDRLIAKQKEYEAIGVSKASTQWKRLQYQIDVTAESIKGVESNLEQLHASGESFVPVMDTQPYQEAVARINQLEQQQEIVKQQLAAEINRLQSATDGLTSAEERNADATRSMSSESGGLIAHLRSLASTARSVTSSIGEGLYSGIRSGVRKAVPLLKAFAKSVSQAFKDLRDAMKNHSQSSNISFNKLLRSVVRYGLGIRSLFILYRKLRNYTKEALENMASQIDEVNKSLSSITNAFAQFKNSLGTAIEPLMTALAPALTYIINLLTKAMTTVGEFFAAFTGRNYIYKATKVNNSYKKSVSDTTKALDEAKEALADYDKLQVITSKDTKAAADVSGLGDEIDKGGFEKVNVSDKMKNFVKKLKDAFKKAWATGDFTAIGKSVGEKLTNTLNNIDWKGIQKTARKIAHSLATFLNGFISPELFGAVGHTIAQALNTAIYTALEFATTFNWKNLGKSLANMVNTFFKEFDFVALAETINAWVIGIYDAIVEFFKDVDWSKVFKGLYDFFSHIKLKTVAIIIGALSIKGIAKIVFGMGVKKALAKALMSLFGGLKGMLSSVTVGELFSGTVMTSIAGIVSAVGGAITAVIGFINQLNDGFNIADELLMAIGLGITWIGTLLLGVAAAVSGPIILAIGLVATAIIMVKDSWNDIVQLFEWGVQDIKDLFGALHEWGTEKIALADAKFREFCEKIPQVMGIALTLVKTKLQTIFDFSKLVLTTLKDTAVNFINTVKNTFSAQVEKIKSIFANLQNNIKSGFQGSWNTISGIIQNIKDAFSTAFQFIGDVIAYCWDGAASGFEALVNGVGGLLQGLINIFVSAINGIIDAINLISIDIPDVVPGIGGKHIGFDISHVLGPTIPTVSIPRLAQGAVIPPNKEFLAMLGDQKQGTNIETPLQTMIDAFTQALDNRRLSEDKNPIVLTLDGKVVARAVWNEEEKMYKQTGRYRTSTV